MVQENFSQPDTVLKPSELGGPSRGKKILTTLIVVIVLVGGYFAWKNYTPELGQNGPEGDGLSKEQKAILESTIKGKTVADINILLHTYTDGPTIVKNNKIQPKNQVSDYDKVNIWRALMTK